MNNESFINLVHSQSNRQSGRTHKILTEIIEHLEKPGNSSAYFVTPTRILREYAQDLMCKILVIKEKGPIVSYVHGTVCFNDKKVKFICSDNMQLFYDPLEKSHLGLRGINKNTKIFIDHTLIVK